MIMSNNILIFCTLFDSNYLDKGIVMIRSLSKVNCNFRIYVLAMDDKCFRVLSEQSMKEVIPIHLDDFIKKMDLSESHTTRSRAEFCWTCTSHLIDYVLTECQEEICTYLDADLYFYSNPSCLLSEMGEKTVQIIKHGFTNSLQDKVQRKHSGTYCIEFNTFKKTPDSMELLHWWEQKCRLSCSVTSTDSEVFGDQMYIEKWGEKDNVSVVNHPGGGVAPWNIGQYRMTSNPNSDAIMLRKRRKKLSFPLVFYHFHRLEYIDNHKVNINVYGRFWIIDNKLVKRLYLPYLRELDTVKRELESKYGLSVILTHHPAYTEVTYERVVEKRSIFARIKRITLKKLNSFVLHAFLDCRREVRLLFHGKNNVVKF